MLSERDRRVLDFEERLWQLDISKQSGIRRALDMSVTRYSQILRRAMDDPDALTYAPLLTRRLRRQRDARRAQQRASTSCERRR
ncbi:MAG: DUF3263 domain-containing protein [Actinobacteria bacterium]|nr:DUF3263 domain-containing protein [Actinomycetota bacterium]